MREVLVSVLEETQPDLSPVTTVPPIRRKRWPATISVRSAEQTSSRIEQVADALYSGDPLDDGQQQIAFAAKRLVHAEQAGNMLAGNDVPASDNTAVDDDPYLQPVVNPEFAPYSGRFGRPPASCLLSWGYCTLYDTVDQMRILLANSSPTTPEAEKVFVNTLRTMRKVGELQAASVVTKVPVEGKTPTPPANSNAAAGKSAATPIKEAAGN